MDEGGAVPLGLADVAHLVHVDRDEVAAPGDDVAGLVRRLGVGAALPADGVVVADVASHRADRPIEVAGPQAVEEASVHTGDAGDTHGASKAVRQNRLGTVLTLDS